MMMLLMLACCCNETTITASILILAGIKFSHEYASRVALNKLLLLLLLHHFKNNSKIKTKKSLNRKKLINIICINFFPASLSSLFRKPNLSNVSKSGLKAS